MSNLRRVDNTRFNPLLLASLIPTKHDHPWVVFETFVSIRYYSRLSFQRKKFETKPMVLWVSIRYYSRLSFQLTASFQMKIANVKFQSAITRVSHSNKIMKGIATMENDVSIRYYSRLSFQHVRNAIRSTSRPSVSIRYYSRLSFQPLVVALFP